MVIKKGFFVRCTHGFFILFLILFLANFSSAVVWDPEAYSTNYTVFEDQLYIHNLSQNITSPGEDPRFSIDTGVGAKFEVDWVGKNYSDYESWIFISNYSTGELVINLSNDSHSGFYRFTLRVSDDDTSGDLKEFGFILTSINDAPYFSELKNISDPYITFINSTSPSNYSIFFKVYDEENHAPINITNLSVTSCSKADWTDRSNCSLEFNLLYDSPSNILLNFSNLTNESVGSYNLTLCINDTLDPSTVPQYHSIDYNESKQYCQNFSLNIFYDLKFNASNCSNLNLVEGNNLSCYVDVYTTLPSQSFTLGSYSYLSGPNFIDSIIGSKWFYPVQTNTSTDYFLRIPINLTNLSKRNVGNWTIGLSLNDSTNLYSENITLLINNINSAPSLSFNFSDASNVTSLNAPTTFFINITDEDFLIPDKYLYNETVNLNIKILNQSNLSQEVFWQNVDQRDFFYISGNSSTITKSIHFTPNSSQVGDWTANFTYSDRDGLSGYTLFNFSVLDNDYPYWNTAHFSIDCIVNSTRDTTQNCLFLNLTNYSQNLLWANDSEIPSSGLRFSTIGDIPKNFNLTSDGLINFTPWKWDVSQYRQDGVWKFNISVSDDHLTNSNLEVTLNVSNINSPSRIENITYSPTVFESSPYSFSFEVWDDDFLIENPSFSSDQDYALTVSVKNYSSNNLSIITYQHTGRKDVPGRGRYYLHDINFTPLKDNVGNYTFNLSVVDYMGILNWSTFNISVLEINNPPIFTNPLVNKTLAVGDQFLYQIDADDIEDRNNLTYNFTPISGTYSGRPLNSDYLLNDGFNFSSGLFNLTLNSSHAGVYRLNITITDSGLNGDSSLNETSWQDFWILVYDSPNISIPTDLQEFDLTENETFVFNFSVNHTIGDNLTYELWMDDISSCNFNQNTNCNYSDLFLVDRFNGYGNSTNISWIFRPNFTQETYGLLSNLTLVVYPSNSNLLNQHLVNSSSNLKLNISHKNHPLSFYSNIPDQPTAKNDEAILINLSQHFLDYDNQDSFYLQNISFTVQSDRDPKTLIVYSVMDNVLRLSLPSNIKSTNEILNITASELDPSNSVIGNVTSNNFQVIFVEPTITHVNTPSSGGSNTVTKHSSLLISVPSQVQAGFGEKIDIPISITNNGEVSATGIKLNAEVKLNDEIVGDVPISLSKTTISSLAVGSREDLIATASIDTRKPGKYLGIIYAEVSSPRFTQQGQFYIEIEIITSRNVEEVLVFTEKLVVENPECIELRARLNEVEELKKSGRFEEAMDLSEQVLNSCKASISQKKKFSIVPENVSKPLYYLFISILGVFFLLFVFYVYKRVKFNKESNQGYL